MSIPSQPMDEGQMFQPPSPAPLKQQVIALSQSYPCPRCSSGILEPFGHTETLACNSCDRGFVPLRGGRLLFPANTLGWRIAPTFWWDGIRWHWGGTTATNKQLGVIVLLSLLPVIALLTVASLEASWWENNMPHSCPPTLVGPIIGLITMQLIYFCCWDFEFCSKKRDK